MPFAMRAGLGLLFVDALHSSLQHDIASLMFVYATGVLQRAIALLWFQLHFVADVKGRFLVVASLVLA